MKFPKYRFVVINSSILFIIATILEMTLHEFGHFFASILVHAKGVSMHHNYVSDLDNELSVNNSVFIKGAGPAVSLIIGIIFHGLCNLLKKRNSFFLFTLFMAVFGYIGFFGYLILAPIFTGGDTGYICSALKFPVPITIGIAVCGAIVLYVLIRNLTPYFVEMGSKEIIEKKESRIALVQSVLFWPVLIGISCTTLLNLPVVAAISLIAPVCSPCTLFWDYGNALDKKYSFRYTNGDFNEFNRFNVVLVLALIITILYNRLLVYGISYN
jgi:uncharacterized membrane protein YiaA